MTAIPHGEIVFIHIFLHFHHKSISVNSYLFFQWNSEIISLFLKIEYIIHLKSKRTKLDHFY